MVTPMTSDPDDIDRLVQRAAGGDAESWAALWGGIADRLRRMVAFRLDHGSRAGSTPPTSSRRSTWRPGSTWLDYVQQPDMPFFLWLRGIAGQQAARAAPAPPRHPDAGRRREVSLYRGRAARGDLGGPGRPAPGAPDPAQRGGRPGREEGPPPGGAQRAWTRSTARCWPCGTSSSSAVPRPPQVLGIKEKAAGMRYVRALRRLKEILTSLRRDWAEPDHERHRRPDPTCSTSWPTSSPSGTAAASGRR